MDITVTVSPSAAAKLNERAAAIGQDVTDYAAQLLEQAVAGLSAKATGTSQDALSAWLAFAESMKEWGKTLPPGHVIDDSRESIYAGRGE